MCDLRTMRRMKALTGEAVCQLVGCSPSTLSLIESGKRRPSVDLAKKIGLVLDFDWTLFFEEEEQPPTPVTEMSDAP